MKRCYSCFRENPTPHVCCPYCGEPYRSEPDEPIYLAPGSILQGRYIIGKTIGEGGFGIVYKAWDSKFNNIVAIKEFFAPHIMSRVSGFNNAIVTKKASEEFLYRKKRFLAEARMMARFGSHKNIPNVFEFFEENNTAYIVMELLKGMTLSQYLSENKGRLTTDFAVHVALEVAKALILLHENNVIHRDVAPDNIFICMGEEIKIKLMDLGAAKLADSTDSTIDIILKPGYSPTEQYDNDQNIGPWTDIYALGATLYNMLTGIKPDESTNRKINDTVIEPNRINPGISENLSNTIMKAMAVERHMRFRTDQEFVSALVGERKVIPLSKEKKRRRTKFIINLAAAAGVALIAVSSGWSYYNSKKTAELLDPAEISIWFSVADESSEAEAFQTIKEEFEGSFPGVVLNLNAIPESEYEKKITEAAAKDELPTLFESTDLPDEILMLAADADNVINSEQFKECLFLDQYDECYSDRKKIPLAIEVPMAFVITEGAVSIDYEEDYFTSVGDFGLDTNVSADENCLKLIKQNFIEWAPFSRKQEFLNNEENKSPVMLSSTMAINDVRKTLTSYKKQYVYYSNDYVFCSFTYEWSIGKGTEAEIKAAEKLLSWMLGNVYQNTLMISKCSDGQIPVNPTCFEYKLESKYLQPIKNIYTEFVFRED